MSRFRSITWSAPSGPTHPKENLVASVIPAVLPVPEIWVRGPLRVAALVSSALLVLVLALLAGFVALPAVVVGDWPFAAGAGLACVFFGLCGGVTLVRLVRRPTTSGLALRVEDGRTVTHVPYSAGRIAVSLTALALVLVPLAWLGVHLATQGVWVAAPIGVVCCAAGWWAVRLRRMRRGGVSLSPEGVRVCGWAFDDRLSWGDVECVLAFARDGDVNGVTRSRSIVLLPRFGALPERRWFVRPNLLGWGGRGERTEVECDATRFDAVVLFHLIRFYNEHPGQRHELGTAASFERVRRRDLLTAG